MKELRVKTDETLQNIVNNLHDHYSKKSNLDFGSSYEDYKKEASIFLNGCTLADKAKLMSSDLKLNENVIIEYPKNTSSIEIFEHNVGFYNFYTAVKNNLEDYESTFLDFKGSDRQKSPPLKAYEFVGHNKELDVSKIGYSYLYK